VIGKDQPIKYAQQYNTPNTAKKYLKGFVSIEIWFHDLRIREINCI
jgi:hypothetical protein